MNTKLGRHAFTAVVVRTGFIIGRADYGTKGYTPIAPDKGYKTWGDAQKAAKAMNDKEGISQQEALEIVFNTMR